MRRDELYELTIGGEVILFADQADALAAAGAMMRGLRVDSAADPSKPARRGATLIPVSVEVRRPRNAEAAARAQIASAQRTLGGLTP